MTDINELLAKLNPKTAQTFIIASEVETGVLPTPSLGLNIALGGGLGYGRLHTFWGNRSSGKSLMCLGLAREAQKKGDTIAWIDAEKNFDPVWARRNGLDPDNIAINRATRMSEVADMSVELITAGVDLLIIDSMSVMLPESFFVEKDGDELKGLSKAGQIGTFAKNYGTMVNMINSVNKHTCVVMISQVRNKISTYGAAKSLMGGEAAEHINSTIIKYWSKPSEEDIKGEIAAGDLLLTKPIGREVTWTIDKARGPGMHQSNKYDMYYAGEYVGIDLVGEILDYGTEYGEVIKSGKWFKIGEQQFNGRRKAVEFLRENEDIREKLYQEILTKATA